MHRTLVVTNDFPPRRGGIESFVFSLCERLPEGQVVAYTASMPGDRAFDAGLRYPVIRDPSSTLVPTRAVAKRTAQVLRAESCDSVLFGAAAPLGLLAPGLRRAGATRIVGLSHGHETWWAHTPLARRALRRIGDGCDVLTYVSEFCRARIATALSDEAARNMVRLAPGVDTEAFRPGAGGAELRARLGIGADQPVVLSVSRLVARKGQDMLIRAMPQILDAVPDTVLLVVGDGPYRRRLEFLARKNGVRDQVMFAGEFPWSEMPSWFDTADVFAGPSRARWGGLEPEALGIVYLEAQATGSPVLVGRSGGAPEAVRHGMTGYVVDPLSHADIAARVIEMVSRSDRRREFGEAARAWVEASWSWDASMRTVRRLLQHQIDLPRPCSGSGQRSGSGDLAGPRPPCTPPDSGSGTAH